MKSLINKFIQKWFIIVDITEEQWGLIMRDLKKEKNQSLASREEIC